MEEDLKSKEDEQNEDNIKNEEENNEKNNNVIDSLPLLSEQIVSNDKSINNKENEIVNEEFEEKNEESKDKKENEENLEEKVEVKEETNEEKKDEVNEEKKEKTNEEKKEEVNEEKKDETNGEKKEETNEEKNNNENKIEEKEKNKIINGSIVKEANKEPDLSSNNKTQITQSMNKIKNKSLESKVTDLLNNDENNKEQNKENENNFKDKLNELSRKAEENSKNTFDFKSKTNQPRNNRYRNYFNNNKDILDSKGFEQTNLNEKRFQELKNKYFIYNRYYPTNLYSSLNEKYFERYNNLFSSNCKPSINNNYNLYSYNKPIVYKKNVTNVRNDKRNDDIIKLMNSCNNFNSILRKIKNSRNNSEEKNNINDDKILYDYNRFNSYNGYNNKYNLYKTTHFDKTSKLKNIINDVLNEIRDDKNNYSLKTDLSNFQKKIRFSRSLNKYSNFEREKIKKKDYNLRKHNNKDFNELLRLCTKENLTKSSQKRF